MIKVMKWIIRVSTWTLTKPKLRGGVNEQSPWLSSVTSVSGAQIINNPWVWYNHNIPPMIKCQILILHIVGPRTQTWVSWSAGALLMANMGDLIVILRMLAVLFTGTQIVIKKTTPTRDLNGKHGLGKTTNLHYNASLGVTLRKKVTGKEWWRSGRTF